MILQNAREHKKEVQAFLKKAWHTRELTIDEWIKYKFDPDRMFINIQDDQIVSILQYGKRILRIGDQECIASLIEFGLTEPNHRNRNYFKDLLEAYIKKCQCNDLISFVNTHIPKPFYNEDFICLSQTKTYTLPTGRVEDRSRIRTRKYRPSFDLYSLYLDFMKHFDGSILLSRQQFENELAYLNAIKKKIDIMFDDHYEMEGFAIYTLSENKAHIETLIYLNSNALENLFSSLSMVCDQILIDVSANEQLERLYPNLKHHKNSEILYHINNKHLFEIWKKDGFKTVEKPQWFQLI